VITVATLTPVKRLELVIAIAALLPHRRFWLVGDGPQHSHLLELAQQHRASNVHFCGRLDLAAVHRAYLSARLFLLTSGSEGTPTVILEAMACGLPIVSSAANDFTSLLEEQVTGYVLASTDAAHYAARIEDLLQDSTALLRMSSENRRRAQRYSWSAIAARITEAMRSQLEAAASAAVPSESR
jgi:glycosyltransferase involved in cell wall biosynthesis